jgi:hypothetical protein
MDSCTLVWLVSSLAPAEDVNPDAAEQHGEELGPTELDDPERGGDEHEQLLNEVIGATVIYPQEQGEIQINFKPGYRDRRTDHLGYANLEIEIGATDWWQFEVAWTAPIISGGSGVGTVAGFGDFELESQFTWMNVGDSLFSAAFRFEVEFPTARPQNVDFPRDVDFGDGSFTYEPFVTLAVDFPGTRGQVFANLGAQLSSQQQLPLVVVGAFVASSIVRPSLVFGWTLEQMSITPGMTILAGEFWEFAFGVPIGLNSRTDRVGVDALIIYEFNPFELVRH